MSALFAHLTVELKSQFNQNKKARLEITVLSIN